MEKLIDHKNLAEEISNDIKLAGNSPSSFDFNSIKSKIESYIKTGDELILESKCNNGKCDL